MPFIAFAVRRRLDRFHHAAVADQADERGGIVVDEGVFDQLATVISEPDFRGCRYLAADLALADPGHPAHIITRQYRVRIHQLLEDELRKLGHPRPAHPASQLLLLIDGTLAAGATRPQTHPAARARELAELILGP